MLAATSTSTSTSTASYYNPVNVTVKQAAGPGPRTTTPSIHKPAKNNNNKINKENEKKEIQLEPSQAGRMLKFQKAGNMEIQEQHSCCLLLMMKFGNVAAATAAALAHTI